MWQRIKKFFLYNSDTRQTVAKNTFWLFWSQIAARLIRVGLVIYAARILGATQYGAFSYALSLAALFTIFIDFGINALITREASRDLSVQEKYFATSLIIKGVMFLIVAVILVACIPLFAHQQGILPLIPIVILIILFDSFRDFGATLARAWERMEVEAFVETITNVFIVIAGIVAIITLPTSRPLLWAYAIGIGMGMIVAFYPFRRYLPGVFKNFSLDLVKPILVSSWPLGMLSLMGALLLNTDSIMIGILRTIHDVGIYAAPQRITQLLYYLPYPIASAFFPPMARSFTDSARFRFLLEKASAALVLIAVPLSIGGVLLSRQIILHLYGTAYLAGTSTFILMNLTYIPVFLSNVLGNALFALNKEKKIFTYVVMGVVGNFIFDLIFIPIWGIAGSAFATLCNQIIITAYLIYVLRDRMHVNVFAQAKKILLASLVMALVVWGLVTLHANVYGTIVLGGGLYFLLLYLFNEPVFLEIIAVLRRSLGKSGAGPETL